MKILFVCTGNTCRSPMAEGILRDIAKKNNITLYCSSAGLCACEGESANENAIEVMKNHGIDISCHIARRFINSDIETFDVIAVMNATHAYILLKAGVPQEKIYLPEKEISDPYGSDLKTYEKTYQDLYSMVSELFLKLKGGIAE